MKCETRTCISDQEVRVRWIIVTQSTFYCFRCALNHCYLVKRRKGSDVFYRRLPIFEVLRG